MNKLLLLAPVMAAFLLLPMVAQADATYGDEWSSIKKTLGNAYKAETTDESLALVADAKAIYNNVFASAAQEHDPATHNVILGCYDAAEEAYKAGDKKQAKLWIQCQEKSVYTIGMVMMEVAISENDADKYLDWSKVVQKKFKVADKDPATLALFTAINSDNSKLAVYSDVVRENMLDIFELKTVEELEEALIKYGEDDTYSAKKYAYEGLYYYRTLDPYLADSIGSDKADQLYGLMEKAMDISDSANDGVSVADLTAQMKDTKKEVEKIVMEHNGIDGTPEALALAGIADRLHLVQVEYVDAIDGSGNIINDMEYAETVAFAGGALEISEENADVLNAISSSELAELQSILTQIVSDVDNKESISEVLNAADDATTIVKSMQAHTGEAGSNLTGYFDTINRLLLSAQAAYSIGQSDFAFELVSEAYLDNYEFLEGPLAEVNPALMKTIEDNMREELRNMIQSGVSSNEVNTQILFLIADLETAQDAVTSTPTAAAAPAPTPVATPQESSEEGGGCLIATAAYGSELAPQVQMLREIRDNQLMNTESGSAFMTTFNEAYYSFSPIIADMERESPMFKEIVKAGLTPMLSTLAIMESAETESEVLGLGLTIIALNLGMYIGLPAFGIVAIRKRF